MPKPKVLVFECSNAWGGIESFIANEIVPLDSQFDIHIVCRTTDDVMLRRLGIRESNLHILNESVLSRKYWVKLKAVLDLGFDIIHFNKNSAVLFAPVLFAAHYTDAKIVLHSHNTNPSRRMSASFLHYVFRGFITRAADAHLACSHAAADYMYGPEIGSKSLVVRNGIDVDTYEFNAMKRVQIRNKMGLSHNDPVVINVGRLSEQKNQRFLLDAFADFLQLEPSATLLLVGEGELEGSLRKYAEVELGISDSVRFLGRRNDIDACYSAADLAVFPSVYEGLPIAMIEAQASGIPLIGSSNITTEVALSNNVRFLDLESGPSEWANAMEQTLTMNVDRSQGGQIVRDNGYTQKFGIDSLRCIYYDLLRK